MPTLGEYSEVAICNLALQEIGRGMMISSIDENSQAARACKLRYPYARDAVLRGYDWNFSTARASLPELATAPAFDFAHQYKLPEDVLRVRELVGAGEADDWRVESWADGGGAVSQVIVTDFASPIQILYTRRIVDVRQFDALFVGALAARIAADIAISLSESTSKAQGLWQIYTSKLFEAWKNDAQEGSAQRFPDGTWNNARFAGAVRPYTDWDPNL